MDPNTPEHYEPIGIGVCDYGQIRITTKVERVSEEPWQYYHTPLSQILSDNPNSAVLSARIHGRIDDISKQFLDMRTFIFEHADRIKKSELEPMVAHQAISRAQMSLDKLREFIETAIPKLSTEEKEK